MVAKLTFGEHYEYLKDDNDLPFIQKVTSLLNGKDNIIKQLMTENSFIAKNI